MKRIPELMIISTERSGTNFFGSCLRGFNAAVSFFEIFAQDAVYGLEAYPDVAQRFSSMIGHAAVKDEDPNLAHMVHAEPVKYLKMLHQSAADHGAKFFSYKIFPGQVHPSKIKLAMVEPEVRVVFLTRRRLDCFISFQKALSIEAWENKDTTSEKIPINAKSFLEWAHERDLWFNDFYRYSLEQNVSRAVLSYEIDVDRPQPELMLRCDHLLKSLGVETQQLTVQHRSVFSKQDRESDPFKKIQNGEELRAALQAAEMLDYALTPFLSG